MSTESSPTELLDQLELTEYEASALEKLLSLGRTSAPNLSEATGIPKARIYGILETLAGKGFIKIIPGRPKEYQPKSPENILDQAIENQRQEFEAYEQTINTIRDDFLNEFQPRYEQATEEIRPAEELFYVVDVGDPSERETKRLYHTAERAVYTLTKSFGFFETIEPAVEDALTRGIDVRALLLHPDELEPSKQQRQSEIVDHIRTEYPAIEFRYSNEQLPWRGTFVDPSMDYSTGKAVLLVEEEEIPNHLRQAAITENGSFVAGLQRYFDLIWTYDSVKVES